MTTTDSPTGTTSIEAALGAWETRLARLEKQAGMVVRAAKQLRRIAQDGTMAGAAGALEDLRETTRKLADMAGRDAEAPPIDIPAVFESGTYMEELAEAAAAANVTLVRRDGRVTAYPVVLRLEARNKGVRIGRQLERRLRPSVVARHLKALQQRPNRFEARSFLDRLVRAYAVLAPEWRPIEGKSGEGKSAEGPLVALIALHEVLTLLPAAAADYPMEEFQVDLLRLDREPDARTARGYRFELGGSTGTKGARRLTVYDETGGQHDYYAIRFLVDVPHA